MILRNFLCSFFLPGFFILCLLCPNPSLGWSLDGKIPCATLFSQKNYTGVELLTNSGDPIPDLNEAYTNSLLPGFQTWNNFTSSVQINDGCFLQVWSNPYFEGSTTMISSGNQTDELAPFWDNSISSLSCLCAANCETNKCPSMELKKGECARAFIETGCNTCKGVYVDLKPVNKTYIGAFHDRGSKIRSIVVRPGCQLIAYEDRDFEGDYNTFDAGIYDDFKSKIDSYNCTCPASDSDVPNLSIPVDDVKIQPKSAKGPIVINIPHSPENITAMLKGEFGRHPGLMAALRSYKNGRSPSNAYILLLGMSGSGKSATINFLFDNVTIAAVGTSKSTTSEIHEYRIPIPVDELGVQNSELRVIDTPGLGDTRGMENDAQFLATLDDYLETHEDLKGRIPNIVLIFAKFNENRFVGTGSGFVKMLRGLDSFRDRLFDKKYSNVVVVLSHFMSVPPSYRRNPSAANRMKEFKDCVADSSLFPKPIVVTVAENKPEEQELAIVNGFYKFPNGDFYPRNLFERIQQAATNGGDPIGEAIIRTAFKAPENFNVTHYNYSLVNVQHSKFSHYLSLLSKNNYNVEETEVSGMLDKAYEKMPAKLKRAYPDTLPYLQKSLNVRNIVDKSDIPKTSAAIIELMKGMRQSEMVMELLEKGLQIKIPTLEIALLTGQSYDILRDVALPSSPFAAATKKISDIGFLLPDTLTCKMENSVANIYQVFDTAKDLYLARLQSLSVDEGINLDTYKAKAKAGYNVLSSDGTDNTLTALWEHRLFQLTLNDEGLVFTKQFRDTVTGLQAFNSTDYESVDAWRKFFEQYGTHVVKSAYGGGAVEVSMKAGAGKMNTTESQEAMGRILFNLVQFAEDVSVGLDSENGNISLGNSSEAKSSLTFRGGDYKFHTQNLEQLGVGGASKLLENWKSSLSLQPVMLQTSMKLVPISEYAKKISDDASVKISQAASAMFNANLVYKPPPPLPPPPPREDTEIIKTITTTFNNQLKELFEEMNLHRKKSDDILLALKTEMKEEADRRDAEKRILEQQIRDQNDEIRRLQEANKPTRGDCLKAGTRILMSDGIEKKVEAVQVGDFVLNKDLKPVRVIAAVEWFLGKSKFYGFDENDHFFTNTHLFVGPNEELYAPSKNAHIETNPLMAYADLNDMVGTFEILRKTNENEVSPVNCNLFQDPNIYPVDTPVYFLELESADGTYFANGFVSRHDIPDFSPWRNTFKTLFTAFTFPSVQGIRTCEENWETYTKLEKLGEHVAERLEKLVQEFPLEESTVNSDEDENSDVETDPRMMEQIFDNDLLSSFAITLYSKAGKFLAERLDNEIYSRSSTANLKAKIISEIITTVEGNSDSGRLCPISIS